MTPITFGTRLRWVRLVFSPEEDLWDVCQLMQIDEELWRRFENDTALMSEYKVGEFSHRFLVSPEFLYRGGVDRGA